MHKATSKDFFLYFYKKTAKSELSWKIIYVSLPAQKQVWFSIIKSKYNINDYFNQCNNFIMLEAPQFHLLQLFIWFFFSTVE